MFDSPLPCIIYVNGMRAVLINMSKKKIWYLVVALVALNITVLAFLVLQAPGRDAVNARTEYPLLSGRIFSDAPNDMILNFVPLRKNLETKFSSLPAGTKYSFYFEYLPSGTSIRIGDDNELVAASLIKVPLVMDLYRAAELGLTDLDQEVTITEDDLDNAYGDLWKQGAGTKVSLRKLARLALAESDNTATHAIFNHVKDLLKVEDQCLVQLDIDQKMQDGQAVITAKSYSSILKSLYFASCTNKKSSNEILSYLTQSNEIYRLTNNLPTDLKVAHKNGVYNQVWSESDCGIVYAENRPYSVCVMIGLPQNEADAFIASVSKDIYDFVITQPKPAKED